LTDLAFLPAVEQARRIRDREVSPVELVDEYLGRADRLDPQIHGYLTIAHDAARRAAKEAEAQAAVGVADLRPLFGVAVSVKDLIDTAGVTTTHGAQGYRDRIPSRDDGIVTRLRAAGCVVIGKTNTACYGVGSTDPVGFEACRNPWDLSRTVGGSSGGAAATVASGQCAISLGGDGGGSIRIPAAHCGVVGIKASRGRVSTAPQLPSMVTQLGPLARTVADAAALLDALAGPQTGDPYWPPPPQRPFLDEVGRDPGRLRIAVSATVPHAAADPRNEAAVRVTADALERLGHHVIEATPPWPDRQIHDDFLRAYAAYLGSIRHRMPALETVDPIIQYLIDWVRPMSAIEYVEADNRMRQASRDVVAFWDDVDVVVAPVTDAAPGLVDRLREVTTEEDAADGSLLVTSTFNITGQPAFSLPVHVHDGLPVGVQVIGRPADEATLFRVAAQLEAAIGWADRRPPVN